MMKLETFPDEEAVSKTIPHAERVTLQQMTEGELLSLSQEELQAELRAGNAMATSILEKAGLKPDSYSADLIAQWASVDVNILEQIRTAILPREQQLRLSGLLQGMVSIESTTIYDGNVQESISTPKFSTPPQVQEALQKRMCLEDHDSAERTWDTMRTEMLASVLRHAPDRAEELIRILRERKLEEIVNHAENRSEASISFFRNEAPLPVQGRNAEELYRALEDQDLAAQRYEEFMKSDRPSSSDHWFDHWFDDEPTEEDEEADVNPPYARPVLDILTQTDDHLFSAVNVPNYDCRWTPDFMVAAVKYVRTHPEALLYVYDAKSDDEEKTVVRKEWDKTEYFLVNVISSLEQLSREEIPSDVLAYIAEQVQRPGRDASFLQPWPWLMSASDPRQALEEYFATKRDREMIAYASQTAQKRSASVLKRTVDPKNDSTVYYHQDGRGMQALAEWLRTHRGSDVYSKQSFEEAITWIEERTFKDAADGSPDHGYRVMQKYGGSSRSWQSDVRWSVATGIRSFILSYCLSSLSLEDAIDLCHRDSLITWPNDPILNDLLSTKLKKPDDCWRLWQHLEQFGSAEHAMLLLKFRHYFRSAFQQDLPRACTRMKNDLLEPLLEAGELELFIRCLDEYAKLDREEAKSLLLRVADRPDFQEKIRNSLTAKFREGVFPAIFRVCYGNLTYPTPKQHPYLEHAEKTEAKLPSPLALFLHFEAKGGTPLFARTIPALHPAAVEQAWWRIVHDQKYVDTPVSSGGQGNEKNNTTENPDRKYADRRDSLLDQPDQPDGGTDDPDGPELPQSPNLKEEPRTVATLSRPLSGGNRYLTTKICDRFNEQWSAHDPMEREACMALREILHQPVMNSDEDSVTLHMRMNHGAVVPMGVASEVAHLKSSHGRFRWAGHWSRRLDSRSEPADVDIEYKTGPDRVPGNFTRDEVCSRLPQELQRHLQSLGKMEDLPPKLQNMLRTVDVHGRPMAEVVETVRQLVLRYYEYCFILRHPEYAKKYRKLLREMPHTGEGNPYLDFIHSLREEHEDTLGRGVCGQLSTVLQASLRSIGIPAYFATGYFAEGTTITTNDGHAWVIVPMLDTQGQLFVKPVESTGGAAAEEVAMMSTEYASRDEMAAEPEASQEGQESKVRVSQEAHRIHQYYRDLLGTNISVSDVEAAAGLIRPIVENDNRSYSRKNEEARTMSLWETLMPKTHLVTPRIADRVEQALDEKAQSITDGTRAILRYLLEEGRQTYDELDRRFQEQGGFDENWWAPRDSNP